MAEKVVAKGKETFFNPNNINFRSLKNLLKTISKKY